MKTKIIVNGDDDDQKAKGREPRRRRPPQAKGAIARVVTALAGGEFASTKVVAATFLSGLILGSMAIALLQGQQVKVLVKDGVSLDFTPVGGELKFLDIFKELFNNSVTTAATKGILEDQYQLYDLSGTHLVAAIQNLPAKSPLAANLQDMVANGLGPFKIEPRKFADIRSPDVVTAFDNQAAEKFFLVISQLRDRCWHRKGFCGDSGTAVSVSTSSELSKGFAATCTDSELLGANVQLLRNGSIVGLPLRIDSQIVCSRPKDNLIVISADDALSYFKEGSLSQITATMFVAPDGYVADFRKPVEVVARDSSSVVTMSQ